MNLRENLTKWPWNKVVWVMGAGVLLLLAACTPMPSLSQTTVDGALPKQQLFLANGKRPLILAYYYIWYDPSSWDHAKRDYPSLGRYSSDDRQVMRQHIQWAKLAGIDGFIVSWKSTDKLNQRLEKLAEIAAQEEFYLALIYQGLDFERKPILVDKVDVDLDYFVEQYRRHPAFDLFARPLVIWSGTWAFSREEIALVAKHHHNELVLLASERNQEGYDRVADLVAGNAYYWSSVNPATYPNYPGKLIAMGKDVHEHQGIWIAPAAPGFDARLIGGVTVVERANGAMLQQQLQGALQSQPDAIGLISWNEFSENSHIEPSENYGSHYLESLSVLLGLTPPPFDTALQPPPHRPPVSFYYGLPMLIALFLLIGLSLYRVIRQARNDSASISSHP